MQFSCKYKGHNKFSKPFERFPLRILKFKATKWKKVQKQLDGALKKRRATKFVNTASIKAFYKKWEKIDTYYKEGNQLKNNIFNFFDKSISVSELKRNLRNSTLSSTNRGMYLYALLKPEFRIDILLWRLNFFQSSYQARQAINEKKVYVNGKTLKGNFVLSKGDMISFGDKYNIEFLNVRERKKRFLSTHILLTFLEVDHYSNNIIIVKDLEDLTNDDFYLLLKDYHNLKAIKDYI